MDLLDIAPSTAVEIVKISGDRELTVRGLHGPEIAAIAVRFPNLIATLVNAGDNVVGLCGLACGPIIAAGGGHLGNEKAEQIASSLLLEDQIKLIKAIIGLSFPNGFNPVMEAIASLATGATTAVEKSGHRVRLKTSPSPSPPSSDEDFRPIMQ